MLCQKRKLESEQSKSCLMPHTWMVGQQQAWEARLPYSQDFKSMVAIGAKFFFKN